MNSQLVQGRALPAIVAAMILSFSLAALSVFAQETGSDGQSPESGPAQFARGAQVWASTCARCHNMRNPLELRDDQWRAVMAHMRVRAGLSGGETRDVLAFLQGSN